MRQKAKEPPPTIATVLAAKYRRKQRGPLPPIPMDTVASMFTQDAFGMSAHNRDREWAEKYTGYQRRSSLSGDRNDTPTSRASVIVFAQGARADGLGVRNSLLPAEWIAIKTAFGNRCVYCGLPGSVMDHVIPLSKGGANAMDNVVTACSDCNSRKRAMDVVDWLEKEGRPIAETLDRISEGQSLAMTLV